MTKDHLELLVDELNNVAHLELLDPNKKIASNNNYVRTIFCCMLGKS